MAFLTCSSEVIFDGSPTKIEPSSVVWPPRKGTLANAPDLRAVEGSERMRSPSIIGRNLHEPRLSVAVEVRKSHRQLAVAPRHGFARAGQRKEDSLTALTMAPTDAERRHEATSSAPSQPIDCVALTKHAS